MIQKYNIGELIDIAGEFDHLYELVTTPPYNDEAEIFELLDQLSEDIKDKMKPKMTPKEIKSVISEWIDEKIEEKRAKLVDSGTPGSGA